MSTTNNKPKTEDNDVRKGINYVARCVLGLGLRLGIEPRLGLRASLVYVIAQTRRGDTLRAGSA